MFCEVKKFWPMRPHNGTNGNNEYAAAMNFLANEARENDGVLTNRNNEYSAGMNFYPIRPNSMCTEVEHLNLGLLNKTNL